MAEADANTQKLTEVFKNAGDKNTNKLEKIAGLLDDAETRKIKDDATQEKKELKKIASNEKQTQILSKLFGLGLTTNKLTERSAKLALLAKDKAKDWGVKKLGAAVGMGKDILGWLIKGAGMAAIYALFKWLQKDGVAIFEAVHGFITDVSDWFSLLFTDPMAALKILWDKMLSGAKTIGGWVWSKTFEPLWAWFKETFPGTAEVLEKLWNGLTQLAGGIGTWLWDTVFSPLWEWVKLLFTDPVAAFDQLLGGLKSLGTWLWNNAILPLWDWVQLLFTDPKLALAQFLQGYASIGLWIYDKAIKPLWDWFEEQFPDAAAFIKNAWAAFMSTPIGEWIYKEVLEPFTKWLDLLFTDPTVAIDQMFTFFEDLGTWIYETALLPLWNWIQTLFKDPTLAIKQMWTFFDDVGTWIFDKVLKPLWDWFEGMFPDVAQKMKDLWAEFTGGGDSIIGQIGTFFKGIWDWFKGMFVFDDIGGAVSAGLDFLFLPQNLVIKLVSSVWDFIKGLFGFKKDEAKLPDDFSIGSMITGFIDDIAKWFSDLFDFDIAAIGRSILGDTLYNLMFATDEEKKVFAAQKELEEIQKKELSEGIAFGVGGYSEEEKAKDLAAAQAALAKAQSGLQAAKIAENPLKKTIPAMQTADVGGGGGAVAIGGTTNVSQGSTTMIQGSSSENKHSNLLNTG